MCHLTHNYSNDRLLAWVVLKLKSMVPISLVGAHRKPRTRKALSAISFKSGSSKEPGSIRNSTGWFMFYVTNL